MSFDLFVTRIAEFFENYGTEPVVRHDRENGLYLAKCGEWRVKMGHNSLRARIFNVRNKMNFCLEMSAEEF